MTLNKPLMVKELPTNERPREKLLSKGAQALSEAELLAILLRTGTKNDSVLRVAERLLKKHEAIGLAAFSQISPQEVSKIKGIGPAKAVTIVAAIELGKRLHGLPAMERPIIRAPKDAADLVMPQLRYESREHFLIMVLSTKNHVLDMPIISIGSLNTSVVDARLVFRKVISYDAAAVILVHNHPSGDPTPSSEDIMLTQKLISAGKLLDVAVLDHIIIGDNKYVSLKEQGII